MSGQQTLPPEIEIFARKVWVSRTEVGDCQMQPLRPLPVMIRPQWDPKTDGEWKKGKPSF
ncbi:hypothetical protein TCAL_11171 [Tigriopus californicus]|uniref:Uncharacterized protein n=1 Tax=Tigriopus californicus TaxID=6832 RepID=A0A553NC22_TIGCA|nr:hypothetical protein TCAL_11171 [Tigriopus californicus]|eukprot:TCALIF_11171-PA protein Name:"Protein of unknown function" AED:0.36 eAED:0.36 QI:0/0/0.5/0.5/0/0.5/2/396/59